MSDAVTLDMSKAVPIQQGGVTLDMSKAVRIGQAQTSNSVSATPSLFSSAGIKQRLYSAADTVSDLLPAAGATVGSLVGGAAGNVPGAVAGATLGGAGGQAAKQLADRALGRDAVPQTSADAAKQIGIEGATQGAIELGTAGLARGAKALAPNMAESALKISERMRGRGRTIGDAALNELTGVRPSTLSTQARTQIANLTAQVENGADAATQAGIMGSTAPAHTVLNDAISGTPRNARSLVQKLTDLRDMLDLNPQAPRTAYTPTELLEIKRGIGKEISSWPMEWQKMGDVKAVQSKLYGAIDGELDRLIPGNAELNQRISSLIPVKQQASRLSQQASLAQNLAHRVAAHTGALAGSGIGGYLGYQEGGPQGAATGAALGLILPEALATPTAQMGLARLSSMAPQAQQFATPLLRYGASRAINPKSGKQ